MPAYEKFTHYNPDTLQDSTLAKSIAKKASAYKKASDFLETIKGKMCNDGEIFHRL